MNNKTKLIFVCIFVIIILCIPLYSQLSPGDLHQSHAFLDGMDNCKKCHSGDNNAKMSENCLSCHVIISNQLDSLKGLHTNPKYNECRLCHVEHHGRDFKLIWWKDGRDNFDRSLIGYNLEGKHTQLKCRVCHQAKNIKSKELLLSQKKNLEYTFLGLNQECLNCHHDEHRGQLSEDCLKCHTFDSFQTEIKYNHNDSKFILTGKHTSLECQKCHKILTDNLYPQDSSYTKFTNINHQQCKECHQDVHKGKFKERCESCHQTDGWRSIKQSNFDHDKTNYQLLGMHAKVTCQKCHKPGQSIINVKHASCQDCHTDFHNKQFAKRKLEGDCQECHNVDGFSPSQFTLELHNQTKYLLDGAHLAIPCTECHIIKNSKGKKVYQFKYSTTECAQCHKNPHKDEVNKFVDVKGCESCHSTIDWQDNAFDHSSTKFPLLGKHQGISCRKCHSNNLLEYSVEHLVFSDKRELCNDCHQDIHQGQFNYQVVSESGNSSGIQCDKCHSNKEWAINNFDHDRLTLYKLDGAHRVVNCDKCHKREFTEWVDYIRYKPIGTDCKSCHNLTEIKQKKL